MKIIFSFLFKFKLLLGRFDGRKDHKDIHFFLTNNNNNCALTRNPVIRETTALIIFKGTPLVLVRHKLIALSHRYVCLSGGQDRLVRKTRYKRWFTMNYVEKIFDADSTCRNLCNHFLTCV